MIRSGTPGVSLLSGTLANSNPMSVSLDSAYAPMTIQLTSSAAGRLIELSADGGANFFTPTYDQTATGFVVVSVLSPITHARFTGAANDSWRVL